MTPVNRKKIVTYEQHRYEMQPLISLKEVLSFVNGRDVLKEETLYFYRDFEFRDRIVSCEKAEFENGDILLVAVAQENDYSENTPAEPATVVMYSCTRLAD